MLPAFHRPPPRRRARGVSLVEVMVVVSILGILAAMAVPNLLPIRDATKLSAASEQIAGVLDDARRRAVHDGRCYRVRLTSQTDLVMERRNSSDCRNLSLDGWETAVRRVRLSDVRMTMTTLPVATGDDRLVFRPNGRLRGDDDLVFDEEAARIEATLPGVTGKTATATVTSVGRICSAIVRGTVPTLVAPGDCP